MNLKCRLTNSFAEIKVDEIETTLFASDKKQIDEMILNLLEVVNDLSNLKDKSVQETLENYLTNL